MEQYTLLPWGFENACIGKDADFLFLTKRFLGFFWPAGIQVEL